MLARINANTQSADIRLVEGRFALEGGPSDHGRDDVASGVDQERHKRMPKPAALRSNI